MSPPAAPEASPAAILVRGPNWTGDLVMATPGFRALRAAHPRAWIALHVRPGLEPLLAGSPWFDAIRPVRSYHRGARALLREGLALREGARGGRFDLGVCLPESLSSALLMRAAGVRRIAGYGRGGRGLLLHAPVRAPASWGRRRLVARERFVLELLASLGVPARGLHTELFTTPEEEERAEAALRAAGVRGAEPRVALAPGASYGTSKLWPAERFAQVGDAAVRAGARVLLVGAPDERALAERVRAAMREQAADLVGSLDLGALKAVLRRSAVLVCNDAGARHVAVALGVPSIVLMGPTSLAKTNWNLERVRVLESDVACRPCYLRTCPIDHRCMTRLSPEQVAAAVREELARAATAPPGAVAAP